MGVAWGIVSCALGKRYFSGEAEFNLKVSSTLNFFGSTFFCCGFACGVATGVARGAGSEAMGVLGVAWGIVNFALGKMFF